ncbi:MAG: hypothetical protein P1P80_01135 [ANME-2 cluster archaeon]|nr:hypothetical protein [ANME-2 cluster archaeon]
MGVDSSTIIELLNMSMGICIALISLFAYRKFSLHIFRRGWLIVALSGIVMMLGSIFRAYYSYANQYLEWAWLGRIIIFIHLVLLVIGIYVLALTAVKMWGD